MPGILEEENQKIAGIPLLSINAGPLDGDLFKERLKEELKTLISYIKLNKQTDNDWIRISCDKSGINWSGTCSFYYKHIKYEFKVEFSLPSTYPLSPPEIKLPQLDGKTPKMYREGKICCDIHFNPLWNKNAPKFGIAHALALGLSPWLAVEIPHLVEFGGLKPQ